jgi:glutamate-ammonia-ligase adenylyltransferase
MTVELSATAEFVVREVFAATVSSRPGKPQLAIFALGKLGTRELTFDADLDLLFVADTHAAEERSGLELIAAGCVKTLSAVTDRGRLYDIDVRLRPEGRNAPLVIDRSAYAAYLSQRASLWERQSLTRLRFLCGDAAVGAAVEKDVRSFVFGTPLPAGWTTDTITMRKTMESRTRTRRDEIIDIKLGPGGMVDVEFLAQMLMLQPGAVPLEGHHRSVPTILGLAHQDVLPARERDEMVEAYRLFRRLELFLRVTMEERGSVLPTGRKLDTLARCALGTTGDALQRTVRETMKRVRATLLNVADRLKSIGAPSQ